MKKLYEISGFNKKDKVDDVAYIIATSPEAALALATFFDNPTLTEKVFELNEFWI